MRTKAVILAVMLALTTVAIAAPTASATGDCVTDDHRADVCSNLSCPGYVTIWVNGNSRTIICW